LKKKSPAIWTPEAGLFLGIYKTYLTRMLARESRSADEVPRNSKPGFFRDQSKATGQQFGEG
jgi:hypothetical protein